MSDPTQIVEDGETSSDDVFVMPTSFAQRRLWLLDQYEGRDSFTYNIPFALHFEGLLNIAALEQSLNEIVHRHEILRTTFGFEEEQPVQIIVPSLSLDLPVIDLSQRPEEERAASIAELTKQEAQRPFNLSEGPLLRMRLLRLAEETHLLLLTVHHIIFDGWSMGVFEQELATLYEAFAQKQSSPLPDLPLQYADFAIWQREWLQGDILEKQLAYWRERLEDEPPLLELPTDYPRPPIQTFRGARSKLSIPKATVNALTQLSQAENSTLFMSLAAAFKVLLYRYTQQEDIAIGSPIANRTQTDIEPLIGFFVNTLVLRTDLSGNPPFRALLRRVRQVALGAYAHQDVPFEKLVETLQPERDISRSPFFQTMFVLQNAPRPTTDHAGLTIALKELHNGTAKFDLSLTLTETDEGLSGFFEYNTDLFEPATIERMSGHFETLLKGIVAAPDTPITQLPLLTEAEYHQIVVTWNQTQADCDYEQCLHELFEAQVEQTPDAVAIRFEERELTYRDLNIQANQLAHHLRQRGVGPEMIVGISTERRPEMLIGLLAILKAGGAYVALDPFYPQERLAFILSDTQAPLVLAEANWADTLSSTPAEVICLDDIWTTINQNSSENLSNQATPNNLAYIIYTSGSTGKPKGVLIEHRSLVNYLLTINHTLFGQEVHHLPTVTHLTFDAALKQIFGPLLRGDTVWLLPQEAVMEPAALLTILASHKRSGLNCVPSLWKTLLDTIEAGQAPPPPTDTLSGLYVGGEVLSPELVKRSLTIFPHLSIYNLYGPSEATANASIAKISDTEPVTIGRPLNNTHLYILDQHLQPLPIGVPGELHIGGIGVGRGYLNRPDLTAKKFIPDPFSDKPQARLYKTGDLVRYRPNGTIEFLGRLDHQVKIRGYRIELGEIETNLAQHSTVQEVIVMAREDTPGDQRLVAYIVPASQTLPSVNEWRAFLKDKLPDYMIPSAFVTLDSFPLTTNGKIDRRALPPPDVTRPALANTFVAPDGPVEEMLADIWQAVLGLDQVGRHDNFFQLGGHSLLAIQVVTRLREDYDIDLPLRKLFELPTIAELAPAIEAILMSEMDM